MIDRGRERGAPSLRLLQAAFQGRSLSLYTKLGFVLTMMLMVGALLIVIERNRPAFAGVIAINAVIGIVQEYRAKRTLDRLALLIAPRATVRRASNSSGEDGTLQTKARAPEPIALIAEFASSQIDRMITWMPGQAA